MYRLYYYSLGEKDPSDLWYISEQEAIEKCKELNNPDKTIQGLGKWVYEEDPSIYSEKFVNVKSSGILRRIDDLGRIAIPRLIRKQLGIKEGDVFELFIENDCIVWKRYQPTD